MLGRGKRWLDSEDNLLIEMLQKGAKLEEIVKCGRFEGRTPQAIAKRIERLSFVGQSKKSIVGQIRETDIVDLETIIKRFVDAFNKMCSLEECSKEDLERFRIIFSAARIYFDLYFKLEEFSEVKSRVERLEAAVAQLAAEKKAETPQQAA